MDGLLSMAANPHANASTYQRWFFPASKRRKPSIDKKKNNPDWVFFSSVIQATDSTFTGWSNHSMAASHAPGIRQRLSNRKIRTPLAACSAIFTK